MRGWFHIVLSALLLNAAYLNPGYCGLFIFIWWIPLWLVVRAGQMTFSRGIVWGLVAFGVHFFWLLYVFLTGSYLAWYVSLFLYALIIIYYALTSGVWLWGAAWLAGSRVEWGLWRSCTILLTTLVAYYYFIANWSCWFLSCTRGYPFLSPLLPLAHLAWFRRLLVVCAPLLGATSQEHALIDLGSISAATLDAQIFSGQVAVRQKRTPGGLGQAIYHRLSEVRTVKRVGRRLVILPESTFPYPLNNYPKLIDLWRSALPEKTDLMIGALREQGDKLYQSLFYVQRPPIYHEYYDKSICVDMAERVPEFIRHFDIAKRFFACRKSLTCSVGNSGSKDYFSTETFNLLPFLCSDFFCVSLREISRRIKNVPLDKPAVLLILANDSWFPGYFQDLLERQVKLNAVLLGLAIVYVAHSRNFILR